MKFKEEFLYYFVGVVVVINAIFLGQDYCFKTLRLFDKKNSAIKVVIGPDRIQEIPLNKIAKNIKEEIILENIVEESIENEEVKKREVKPERAVVATLIDSFPIISFAKKRVKKTVVQTKENVYTYNVGHDKKVLSDSVLTAINRAIAPGPKKIVDKITRTQSSVNKPRRRNVIPPPSDLVVNSESENIQTTGKEEYQSFMKLMDAPKDKEPSNGISTIYLMPVLAMIEERLTSSKIHDFEFVPDYDRNKIYYDDDGVVTISEKIRGKFASIRGTVSRKDMIPTKIELIVDGGAGSFEDVVLPMFSDIEFNNFIESRNLTGMGGAILVKMNDYIVDVEIDSEYEERIYLNEELVVTDDIEMVRYALFIGVNTGNSLIEYLTTEEKIIKKVIGIVSGEIFYDAIEVSEEYMSKFELFEIRPLARKDSMLNISVEDINYVEYKTKFTKGSLNLYEFYKPMVPYGTRNYFEFKHLGAPIFVGSTDETNLYIPSIDFITRMFDQHGIEELFDRCMIQINFPKNASVSSVDFDGEGADGSLYLHEKYLDSGGVVSNEITVDVTNMTILSEYPGTIALKIRYLDKSVDILNSVCVKNSYLVEQLE